MGKARKIFKDAISLKDQIMLLPPTVNDFVPEDSEVRAFSEIIDIMDHSMALIKYRGGGAPAYNPIMLAKVIIYADTGLKGKYCWEYRGWRKGDIGSKTREIFA